jgi:hypothetical protein
MWCTVDDVSVMLHVLTSRKGELMAKSTALLCVKCRVRIAASVAESYFAMNHTYPCLAAMLTSLLINHLSKIDQASLSK